MNKIDFSYCRSGSKMELVNGSGKPSYLETRDIIFNPVINSDISNTGTNAYISYAIPRKVFKIVVFLSTSPSD